MLFQEAHRGAVNDEAAVMFAVSQSGETEPVLNDVRHAKQHGHKIVAFTRRGDSMIADAFELAAGKSISTLTLLEAAEFGNVDCTVTVTAFRDGKQIGSMQTELVLHAAYLWPKEVL